MDLTTLARVKLRKDLETSQHDALISEFITAASQTAELLMGRHAQSTSRTEVVRLSRFQRTITLQSRPLVSVSSVKVSSRPSFDDVSAADADSYDVLADQGQVRLTWGPPYDPVYVEVVCEGGMAEDTDAFVAAFPEIADAMDVEVIHRLNRRLTPGAENAKLGEATVVRTGPYGLHKHLCDVLQRHRIRRL